MSALQSIMIQMFGCGEGDVLWEQAPDYVADSGDPTDPCQLCPREMEKVIGTPATGERYVVVVKQKVRY